MSKRPFEAPRDTKVSPSKVKRNVFQKKGNAEGVDGEGTVQRKPQKRNQLKLNEFHQTVKRKNKVSIKKKIRDINRLVQMKTSKDEVEPGFKEQKEQQIKDLKKKQRESRKRRFMIQENEQKYKKIKFFEEQKLKRKLKPLQNKIKKIEQGELDGTDPENNLEELQKQRERIVEDLNYIKYYPLDKKYVALFPAVDDDASKEKRQIMRNIVKEIMSRRAVNLQKSLERITNDFDDRRAKTDTFFEAEEVQAPQKKKIVDKKGRIITPEDF